MAWHPSKATRERVKYGYGFGLSLLLTFVAYNSVVGGWLTGSTLLLCLVVLALVQMVVQLLFFLHLDTESRPRLKLAAFGFMTTLLLIVVIGSLWIMHHLNYNMMEMDSGDKDTYMNSQRDKGF